MLFNIALNYGGRAEIVDAARARDGGRRSRPSDLDERRFSEFLYTAGQPDPDLLIRTSGEMRVSNFLLWQIAYAEIWVTDTLVARLPPPRSARSASSPTRSAIAATAASSRPRWRSASSDSRPERRRPRSSSRSPSSGSRRAAAVLSRSPRRSRVLGVPREHARPGACQRPPGVGRRHDCRRSADCASFAALAAEALGASPLDVVADVGVSSRSASSALFAAARRQRSPWRPCRQPLLSRALPRPADCARWSPFADATGPGALFLADADRHRQRHGAVLLRAARSAAAHCAQRISPRKTIEGAVGGFVFGAARVRWRVGVVVVADVCWRSPLRAALSVAVVALGIAGDLFESMLKRSAGVEGQLGADSRPRRHPRSHRRAALRGARILHRPGYASPEADYALQLRIHRRHRDPRIDRLDRPERARGRGRARRSAAGRRPRGRRERRAASPRRSRRYRPARSRRWRPARRARSAAARRSTGGRRRSPSTRTRRSGRRGVASGRRSRRSARRRAPTALEAVLAAIERGKTIALANKEVLVMAGGIVTDGGARRRASRSCRWTASTTRFISACTARRRPRCGG